jgi:hypothetical protein
MTEERIIAYLLEELPEAEMEQFEDECFAQESWPEQINLVEEDLIDDYLRDKLAPEQRRRFEQNYLTIAARHERVSMAAALLRHVDVTQAVAPEPLPIPPPEPTWLERLHAFWNSQMWQLRAAASMALVVLIAGVGWIAITSMRAPRTLAPLTLTISASNRGEGATASRVTLPPEDAALPVSLILPEPIDPAARYRVELLNEKGEIKPLEINGQDAKSVSVIIPAGKLSRGRHALKLFMTINGGPEQRVNGSYLFTVE